jgi:hypothetical protein
MEWIMMVSPRQICDGLTYALMAFLSLCAFLYCIHWVEVVM